MLTLLLSLLAQAAPSLPAAVEAYEFGELERAKSILTELLDPVRLGSSSEVVAARQYLGATHYLLGDLENAETELARLLSLAPEHRLDPGVFPPELVRFFERVRAKAGLDAPPGEPQGQPRGEVAPAAPPSNVTSTPLPQGPREPPFWPAFMPFGVGQLNNGRTSAGVLFLTGETVLLGTALTTFLLFRERCSPNVSETCEVAPEDEGEAATLQTVAFTTLYAGLAMAVVGVVHAIIDHPGAR